MLSRSTVCFQYLSEWPTVRYGILAECQGKRCATVSTGKKTSSHCYNSQCHNCVAHTNACTQSAVHTDKRADSGKQERGTKVIWLCSGRGGRIRSFPKDLDWSLCFTPQAAIGLVLGERLNSVEGLESCEVCRFRPEWFAACCTHAIAPSHDES